MQNSYKKSCTIALLFILLLAFGFPAVKARAEKPTAIIIDIGNNSFEGVFYDNETAREL